MKHIFGIFLALFLIESVSATPAVVTGVDDGDTLFVFFLDGEDKDPGATVRFANMDAPEKRGICKKERQLGQTAYDRLVELLPQNTVVELQNIKKDKNSKRIVANVILSDGRDVGEILITENIGRSYDGKHESWCE